MKEMKGRGKKQPKDIKDKRELRELEEKEDGFTAEDRDLFFCGRIPGSSP